MNESNGEEERVFQARKSWDKYSLWGVLGQNGSRLLLLFLDGKLFEARPVYVGMPLACSECYQITETYNQSNVAIFFS